MVMGTLLKLLEVTVKVLEVIIEGLKGGAIA